jgi:hypothetical protein
LSHKKISEWKRMKQLKIGMKIGKKNVKEGKGSRMK